MDPQGGKGPGSVGRSGEPGVPHGPAPEGYVGEHDGDDEHAEGPAGDREEFPVPRRARQAQEQAEIHRQERAAKAQREAAEQQEVNKKVLDSAFFEAEVQYIAVGLGSTPGLERFGPATLEKMARMAMADEGFTARQEEGPEARIKKELQAQKDQLGLLKSVRRQLEQLGKWQVYAVQARKQLEAWTAELSATENRIKSVERRIKELAEDLPMDVVETELKCNPTQSEAIWRAHHRRERCEAQTGHQGPRQVPPTEWAAAATPQGGGSEAGEPAGFHDFLGEAVGGHMVPEDRAKRKGRPGTEDLPYQPATAARKAGRSTTPVRCIRPEALQALAAVRAEEQRAAATADQRMEAQLQAAALARGSAASSSPPLALSNAYGPLQRPATEDEASESMATTDADDGRGSDRSRGSRGTSRSALRSRRAKAMQRRAAGQAGATGNMVLERAGASTTGQVAGTILG